MLMNDQLALRLAPRPGNQILDAGCGEGSVALYLAERHDVHVDGIDLLDFNIAKATSSGNVKQLIGKVSFQVASYMNLPFSSGSFDAVYTMETLVHAPDYHTALTEFHRVLRPGGKLVLFEYSLKPDSAIEESEKESMRRIKQINEIAAMPAFNDFTFGSMQSKLTEAGFSNITSEDITIRALPMLKRFYDKARGVYKLARVLHVENHLVNGMSAVEFYENQSLWRYEITTAIKQKVF